ncbi:MAG: ATP-binding protein, partial [Bacteroidota bacterium]
RSRLLRLTLENSRDKTVALSDELAAIEKYLEVQNLGTTFPIQYDISVTGVSDQKKVNIPPMMIQPFVENAVEHGFDKDEKDKQITIDFKMEDNKLSCSVVDNGKGVDSMEVKTRSDKKSLSTTITAERLVLFAKEFKVPTGLKINDRKTSGDQGTEVMLTLPYKISLT